MGKLQDVLSRRILWFARRRFMPAEAHARMKQCPKRPGLALALAVTVGLACAETEAVAPSEVPAPGSVNAPQKDTANVSVAVGATYVVETTSPYGPPFVVSGSGDPLIATVRGMTTDPGGVHSVEVTGVAEGSTTWDVVWDDYSTAPYSFGLSVSITVTAGSGTPPVAVPVERALVTVGATHTVDVGYQPTVSKTDGDDGLVTATPTTTGATFTGVAAGSATFRLEWTNGDAETQQRDVVITVTDGNVPTDTLELEIGGQIDVPSGGISAVTVTHLGGDEDVATVTAYHENRVHGARAAGNETGVATWRMTWQNYGQGEVAGLRHLYIEVLAEASTDSLTVAVGAFDTVTVGHQPTVEHTGGDANSARVTATSTGAEILGLAQGTSEHLLTWDDPSLMPSKQRKRLTLTVPEPPPPPVDSIKRLKIGRSHEVNVGYEPVSVSYTSGNERIVTAAATSTGATITAVGEGTASLRLMWLDANSITWMRDVVVTVPPPPPPIADSPILALGDTIFWDNNGLPRNDVRHVSGDAGIVKIEPYIESGRTGVRIVGRSAGFGVYEIETFVTSPRIAFVKRKLYITVLASLPGGKQALDLIDSDRSVQEGDTVYVRAILQAPADGEVRIPLTLTAQPLPASVGRHGYAEEALTNRDAAFLDSNATTIVIADGDQYGTVGVVVVDDAHVEPASSEVVRITAIVPNDVELASRGSYADLRIAEGVCDRHPGLHRSYRIGAIQDARWYGSECYELTDGAISSIKTFAANLGNSQKTADFKFGDFAGLTAVKRFTLAGFEGEGSAWSNSLFRDLNAVEHLTLSDWQLHTIPTQMFHGINAAVKSAMLHMDAHGNDDPTREVNAVVIAAGAFGPLSGVDRIELGGFHATRLTRSSMRVFAGVKDVRIRDFPHLTTINDDAFKDLSNLTQLRLVNLPQLGDRGLPDGLLRAQVATLEGLYLNNLGLVAKRMHRLFSGVTPPTALINLDLTGNRYATARYVARALTFPNLRGLHFESNRIATLDPAAFEGINLTTLHLNKNPGAPFQIASRLQVKDDTLVRVRTDASLPAALSFRVYGQNLDGDELSLSIPPGSNYSDWTSVTRTDQSQQVLLRATLGESLSDDITGLALAFSEQGAGEAILYRQPGQGGNRLPVIVKDFGDIGLSLGSTTRPEVATWTADLTSYVRGEVATRALTYSANSADTTVATAVVDGAELTVSGVAMGTTVITVTAADGPQSLSLTIAVEVEQIDGTNFNIQIVKVGDAQREPLSSVIDRAAAYWESALRDAPDVPLDPNGSRLSCRGFRLPERQSVVDDIIMIIGAISIDGDGGTLASASVCVERDGSYGNASELPVMGRFVMDRADMDYLNSTPGGTYGTVLHEMGHLLGIGWTWYDKAPIGGLSYDPGGDRYHSASRYPFVAGFSPNKLLNGADIAYLGVQAFEGWKDSGGTRSLFPLDGAPIATEGGGGSFGVHWSEARMRSELMTPYKNHPSPLSAVTFNSLTDLGWTVSTDFTAEAYRVPGAAPEVSADAAADQGTAIDLSNDVLWVPVTRVSRDGQVTDLYEPPQMNSPENLRILDLIDAALRRAGLRLDDPF